MFTKILIANRGEIAARVITTARRLGIATVAVHSDADAGALHVAMADEAVHIGPAAVADSYLRGDRIIAAALRTGAQAIHPGYGFLSENPGFVEAVQAAGLVFIGPPASAIRAMGLKDAAKALMQSAGVPVVPGYHGERQEPALLAVEAAAIGYPVLIKARAGGGGKGMRLVTDPADFAQALESAAREAQASFGDPACLVEKYITQPRHIEIQVFGDTHGNVVHLFERDCSLQRRHQKVIEEAPAPGMPAEVRAAMGRAAVEAARAIGYQGAGTVEFIVDGAGPPRADGFWFMEMNTRLQVEHPVSEAITGLDFVELQLRVAAGEVLPFRQEDLAITGHAFEARLYAEDVDKGFLPAIGRLTHLGFPAATSFARGPVRIDAGVRQGDDISPWYDPMIAKVIVHGPDRAAALRQLATTLDACRIAGCTTNVEFLAALARHDGFAAGHVDTGLIARDLPRLTERPAMPAEAPALAALAALHLLDPAATLDPWDRLTGWRGWGQAEAHVTLDYKGHALGLRVQHLGPRHFRVTGPDLAVTLDLLDHRGGALRFASDGHQASAHVVIAPERISLFLHGHKHDFTPVDPLQVAAHDHDGGLAVIAPMPGLVSSLRTRAGTKVTKGTPLLVLEAMKMEHILTAPRDATVREVLVAEGDQVSDGTMLVQLETDDA
ncbi:acetyl/propionyl/methylcrotonyl-CoA carboxylase subunit alpha [Tabrizicola oligotrophica]|uniref:Acetyl/propionyl/methylcrotonyl-CoA carboxylase subunit alpha n=1 Tax=Tabrizicola oligotrophica TaxID=2710650 RepID=A0A6M0QTW6_9RHOB|nr:acetyl/propionyl/methylcrotonyl-CoA carboxylase subunit alpha [Tabrizicola oligotrophica]NEY90083.1 acetyl/propionyl/methylcrotonyl-CoA carboxylase subunit alpha [Tabrizicola oligotrophica]